MANRILIGLSILICMSAAGADKTVPRVRFSGDRFAEQATVIFAETLKDMHSKMEYGENPQFGAGFLHTSTDSLSRPNYYKQMWARDCGRGVMELARLGFSDDAKLVARYFLKHINLKDHWGREIHRPYIAHNAAELDGNAWILSAICTAWQVNGRDRELGREFCEGISPVLGWVDSLITVSPFNGLLPSISELSGNPSVKYPVYSIFGNYGMYVALNMIAGMAGASGENGMAADARRMCGHLESALSTLISDGRFSYAPAGCWFNGFDSRTGAAYDISDWDGTAWPIWHWTRQLPYIQDYDNGCNLIGGKFKDVHNASYQLLRHWMAKGEYFRKYGFVSNSGWTGMGERHDETMCGYGQGFFTQAALMADDVNTYSKCLEGIARLGYDGGVIEQMSYDRNPFLMNECFDYDNYEKGLDHTFGTHKNGRREIMENPSDEGNLVQEAEILKAFSLVTGAECRDGRLVIMPRLPWLWSGMECRDWPVTDKNGDIQRVDIKFTHERWLGKCTLEVKGAKNFDALDVRFGPFPKMKQAPEGFILENIGNASWLWAKGLKNSTNTISVEIPFL
ncbi:MAG: hypothetical protein ACI3ZT_04865 [Candidatus Cryptobacteroides sp.]